MELGKKGQGCYLRNVTKNGFQGEEAVTKRRQKKVGRT